MTKFFKNIIKIKSNLIGQNVRTFIIAEIGINHKGSLKNCKKMLLDAKRAGADAVKIQIVNHEESYQRKTKSFSLFKKASLSFNDLLELKKFAKKKNILLFATPGDISSLEVIKKLRFPLIKISSSNFNNVPLINKILKTGLPVIASTGMANLNEIKNFLKAAKKHKNNKIILLSCKSIYPVNDALLNLKSISTIKKLFNTIVGYSDHTQDELSCLTAVALGAKVIEKHFTSDHKIKFADYKISSNPSKFKEMVKNIRRIELMRGNGEINPSKEEIFNRLRFRRYLVAKNEIVKGEIFKLSNISVKRIIPNKTALHSGYLKKIIGKKSKLNIKKDTAIIKKFFT